MAKMIKDGIVEVTVKRHAEDEKYRRVKAVFRISDICGVMDVDGAAAIYVRNRSGCVFLEDSFEEIVELVIRQNQ